MRRAGIVIAVAIVAASCASPSGVTTIEANVPGGATPTTTDGGAGAVGLEWAPCAGPGGVGPELECAALEVPLDHEEPDGETIELAVARVATADPDDRIGSLVFNPGGPGASGIEFLRSAAILMPAEISERFDLVSFDPRGVGDSTSVDCEVDFDDDIALLEEGDDAAWRALLAEAEARPATCTADTRRISSLLGTNNAARDMDRLRAALGDERLSYVGFSYGTRLGATYAELFPDRVRALVLDGAVKPTTDSTEIAAEQAASLDRAFVRFAEACDADPDCELSALGPTLEVYAGLASELDATGALPTDDPERVLTPGELRVAAVAALYSTQLWPVLAEGLADAVVDGDGSLLQALTDSYLGRLPDGTYDGSQNAGFTINCADDPVRPPEEVVRAEADEVAERSVWFDDLLRASTGCIGGPEPVDPLLVGAADGAPPILVVGTTGDPATPYEWSVEMAATLASAELFTVESDGHTAFLSVPCVEGVVVDYLVDLELPPPDASCVNETVDDVFPPPGEGEFGAIIALFDCLRENGADIPELTIADLLADPTGESLLEAIDPTDPDFGLALLACQDLIPS